jgi:hypothetical protein
VARARTGQPVTNAEAAEALEIIRRHVPIALAAATPAELANMVDGLIRMRERHGTTRRGAPRPARKARP